MENYSNRENYIEIPDLKTATELFYAAEQALNQAIAEFKRDSELAEIIGERDPEGIGISTESPTEGSPEYQTFIENMTKRGALHKIDPKLNERVSSIIQALRNDDKVAQARRAYIAAKKILLLAINKTVSSTKLNEGSTKQYLNEKEKEEKLLNILKKFIDEEPQNNYIKFTQPDVIVDSISPNDLESIIAQVRGMSMAELHDLHGRLLVSRLLPFRDIDQIMEMLYHIREGDENFDWGELYAKNYQGEEGHPDNWAT